MMCRERSKRAQSLAVTLRKVSLRLADITLELHMVAMVAVDALSTLTDKAIALGEKHWQRPRRHEKNHSRIAEASAASHEMPTVP